MSREIPTIEAQDAAARLGLAPLHVPTDATKSQRLAYLALTKRWRAYNDDPKAAPRCRPPSVDSIVSIFAEVL